MAPISLLRRLVPITIGSGDSVNLDLSGVAGFFGGDAAVASMETIHIYKWRKYLGWYNTPGSYEIARQYGQAARWGVWDGLYPGPDIDPSVLFKVDGAEGPRYLEAWSGKCKKKSGHVARLLMDECAGQHIKLTKRFSNPDSDAASVRITMVDLQEPLIDSELTIPYVKEHPVALLLSLFPIVASAVTLTLSVLFRDNIAAGIIAFGMFASGFSRWLIGMGKLKFEAEPESFLDDPSDFSALQLINSGDTDNIGLLVEGNKVVIMKGSQRAMAAVAGGRFQLTFGNNKHYHRIGISSLLLTLNFIAQLLVVPQCTLSGQIMFLTSLGASWLYHSLMVPFDRTEKIQRKLLYYSKFIAINRELSPHENGTYPTAIRRYPLTSIRAGAVFALLITVFEDSTFSGPWDFGDLTLRDPGTLPEHGADSLSRNPFAKSSAAANLWNMLSVLLPGNQKSLSIWKKFLIPQLRGMAHAGINDSNAYKNAGVTEHVEDQSLIELNSLNDDTRLAMGEFFKYRILSERLRARHNRNQTPGTVTVIQRVALDATPAVSNGTALAGSNTATPAELSDTTAPTGSSKATLPTPDAAVPGPSGATVTAIPGINAPGGSSAVAPSGSNVAGSNAATSAGSHAALPTGSAPAASGNTSTAVPTSDAAVSAASAATVPAGSNITTSVGSGTAAATGTNAPA